MRAHHHIIVLDNQIVDGDHGQVILQPLPVCAIIQRDEDAGFSADIEQARLLRVFAHAAGNLSGGEVELLPCRAIIACLI